MFRKANFAHLATLQPDGSPQVTPVWVDVDGDVLRVNTAEGRRKVLNVRRDPRVAISLYDNENPYAWVLVHGTVTTITSDGADAHIDSLAKKYLGADSYPFRVPHERRVILIIRPDKVVSST